MGRRRGEEKRSTGKNSNKYLTAPKESIRAKEERFGRAAGIVTVANNGELPLFFPATSNCRETGTSVSRRSSKSGHGRSDVSADVHLGEVGSGWPTGSQEIATWASSFRFELDAQDGERLRVMLERDAQGSGGNIDSRSLTESPGGSFRFRTGVEEQSGKQFGHLKPPRQLENIHGLINRPFPAADFPCANEKLQEYGADAIEPRDRWSVVQVEAPRLNRVAVDVPNSPGREVLMRRLSDLKTHPSSPSFVPDDIVSYHKEMARMASVRDDLHHSPKIRSSLLKGVDSGKKSSSAAVCKGLLLAPSRSQSKPQETSLGELEIMPIAVERRLQSKHSVSGHGLRGSPQSRPAQSSAQEINPTTPTSRFRNGGISSIQEQIVSIRKQSLAEACTIGSPSPDHTPFVSVAIPFKWEEEPGKPKTVAHAVAHHAAARRLSREGIGIQLDLQNLGDETPPSSKNIDKGIGPTSTSADDDIGNGDVGRTSSHRYYGRAHLRGHSRETSLGRSSRRYVIKEAQIDLDGSAAAKFLVEQYDTPLSTPNRHSTSSPRFAVPFEWEDAPGKAKVETSLVEQRPSHMLQLPPRLAVPSYHNAESFSRELRASHSFTGLFSPCMTASSPVRKQSDRAMVQYTSSKSLPPRVPPASPPDQLRKRHGFVGRCSSTPQEGCQIRLAKPFSDKGSYLSSSEKGFVDALSAASSPALKPRSLFSSATKPSPSCLQKSSNPNAPLSPRSILCGPDEGSSQASTSNTMFSSGDLEDFTRQTNRSGQSAASKSSSSHESIEQNFAEPASPSCSAMPQGTPHPTAAQFIGKPEHCPQRAIVPPDGVNSLLKLSKADKSLGKQKSQKQQGTAHSPKVWSPTLANYFQSLEVTEAANTTTRSTSTEDSTNLLDKQGAPTSSGYLNCKGEPLALKDLPTIQSILQQEKISSSPLASPYRPTRLPYTMPSVAEQVLATCGESARRQLIQDLSPRLLRQYSERRLSSSNNSGANTPAQVCQSPAYAAALELLSPAMTQRRKGKLPLAKPPAAKPRRRARFMLSICKTLKRVLCRQRRRKTIEPKPKYRDVVAPTTFQFLKPN